MFDRESGGFRKSQADQAKQHEQPTVSAMVNTYLGTYPLYLQTTQALVNASSFADTAPKYEDAIDLAFVLKQMSELHESLQKQCDQVRRKLEASVGGRVTMDVLSGKNIDYTVRARFATGTVDIGQEVNTPSYGSADYEALLMDLGVPIPMINAGVFKPSYTKIGEMVTELARQGKPPPRGLGKPRPVFKVKYLPKPDSTLKFSA